MERYDFLIFDTYAFSSALYMIQTKKAIQGKNIFLALAPTRYYEVQPTNAFYILSREVILKKNEIEKYVPLKNYVDKWRENNVFRPIMATVSRVIHAKKKWVPEGIIKLEKIILATSQPERIMTDIKFYEKTK